MERSFVFKPSGKRWVIYLLFAITVTATAQPSFWDTNAKLPIPQGAKVTLEANESEFFLGENVLIHFTLENTGAQPFEADFGGDYRGATRALRFKVTATDETGRTVEDPDPSGFCNGGFGGSRTLKPGDKFGQSLPLMRYCQIDRPGRYTIRVTHDFGWKEGERKRPVGEMTVLFRMPTSSQAEEIVAAMEKLPDSPDNTYGERARDYSDFYCIRQPVYLEPLLPRARKADFNALEGISWIGSRDATKALIELSTNANSKLALEAAKTLSMRLPAPALYSTNGFGGFPPFTKEARRKLADSSWDANLAAEVRHLATNYLAHSEMEDISAGAFMIEAVGTTNEAQAVRAALDRVLEPMVTPRRDPKDNILDQPNGVRQLLNAMGALHSQGFTIDERRLSGDGAFLLYFSWLTDQPNPRPEGWLRILTVFGDNGRYPIRVAALNSIPEPVPTNCLAFVKTRLADEDLGVVRAACTIAGKSGHQEFIKSLVEIVDTEHHEWLLREASDAARKLGANFDLLDAWADRLAEDQICHLALENLNTVLDRNSKSWLDQTGLTHSRGDRIALRRAWKVFLTDHADEIRQGKKFKASDLSPALIGHERNSEGSN